MLPLNGDGVGVLKPVLGDLFFPFFLRVSFMKYYTCVILILLWYSCNKAVLNQASGILNMHFNDTCKDDVP